MVYTLKYPPHEAGSLYLLCLFSVFVCLPYRPRHRCSNCVHTRTRRLPMIVCAGQQVALKSDDDEDYYYCTPDSGRCERCQTTPRQRAECFPYHPHCISKNCLPYRSGKTLAACEKECSLLVAPPPPPPVVAPPGGGRWG